jgi:phosphoribosylformylglycinamidine cyclo-ligase
VKEALALLQQVKSVKAFAHITSDGLLNLLRVEAKAEYVIDHLPPVPPVFALIQQLENLDSARMFEVFNMGIGFCAVVDKADADHAVAILGQEGKQAFRIGYVKSTAARRLSIPARGLIGTDKHFRAEAS